MEQMHIEQLYQHVINIMKRNGKVAEFSKKLAQFQSNSERVGIVFDLLSDYQIFPEFIEIAKESSKSEMYRNMGNDFFKKKNDEKALESYNRAINNAPLDSRELTLAYANRSAVLYSYKKYAESINDINRALKIGYDDNLKPKILKRKSMCEEAISGQQLPDEVQIQCRKHFILSKEQHPSIPCASKSIELTYSEDMGRSVIATDNIVPGEVVAVEHPYCCIILEPFYLQYCYGCLKLCNSMIPCKHCCFVMFCSEECFEKSWHSYHSIECRLMPLLSTMKFTILELLAFRTVVQTKCNISNWKKLQDIIHEAESVSDPCLKGFIKVKTDANSSDHKYIFDSSNYESIHTLVTNVEKRTMADIFQKSVTSAVCLYFLKEYTSFFADSEANGFLIDKQKCISLIGGLLLHHNMTGPSNMHTIGTISGTKLTGFVDNVRFGGGAYPFYSLLNHSCAQNVVRCCNGSSIALVALRPIKKGQQLFDNYGFHHATDTRNERQEQLKFQYKFDCACEACLNNWPLYHDLPPASIQDKMKSDFLSHKIITEELIDDLKKGDRAVALHIINQLYPYATILEESAPSSDLADYQETIKQCWSLFGNVAPLREN